MKNTSRITSAVAITLMSFNSVATLADGCMMPRNRDFKERRERSYINEPEQKALIYFHGGIEDLVISPSFQGAPSDFAWVVPVPTVPKIEVLRGAPFHELVRWAYPEPVENMKKMAKFATGGRTSGVRVIEEKNVGAYHVAVLSATDVNALSQWLKFNDYHLPDAAVPAMNQYIKEGWTFVASKIKNQYTGNGLSEGVLAPLRLTFASSHPIYPMRLSAANPTPFKVLVFLAYERGLISDSATELIPEVSPVPTMHKRSIFDESKNRMVQVLPISARRLPTFYPDNPSMPSILKLCPQGANLFVQELNNFSPQNCTKDLHWTGGNYKNTNVRMIK